FPNTFKPLSEMPASIREHVRYPEDIFAIQAQVYATYHMTQPAVYYNREDQWEIPTVDDGNDRNAMQPYYTIMRLPGEKDAEFIQMLPFTPRRRALRTARRLRVPETEAGVRPAAGRRAHRAGPGDLAADHPVESARL